MCSFTAHIPPDQIHAFNIEGDVNVNKIQFYHFPRINMAYKTFTHAGRWNEVSLT
jgi:hypothetical protein